MLFLTQELKTEEREKRERKFERERKKQNFESVVASSFSPPTIYLRRLPASHNSNIMRKMSGITSVRLFFFAS